jgi:hypothetical protein
MGEESEFVTYIAVIIHGPMILYQEYLTALPSLGVAF